MLTISLNVGEDRLEEYIRCGERCPRCLNRLDRFQIIPYDQAPTPSGFEDGETATFTKKCKNCHLEITEIYDFVEITEIYDFVGVSVRDEHNGKINVIIEKEDMYMEDIKN